MRMRIFDKGQVVIPSSLRKKYNINIGDVIEVIPGENEIRLIPMKKERLTDKLYGVFSRYKSERPALTEAMINEATETGFVEKTENEIDRY